MSCTPDRNRGGALTKRSILSLASQKISELMSKQPDESAEETKRKVLVGSGMTRFYSPILRRLQPHIAFDSGIRRILQNSGWLLGANTLALGLKLVQTIILASALGVENYGVLTLILIFTLTLNEFLLSRAWETVIKFMTKYSAQGDHAKVRAIVKLGYLVDGVTGIAVFILLIIAAEPAANLLIGDPAAESVLRISAVSVLLLIPIGTSSALLRVADRFDWIAFQSAGLALLQLLTIAVALALDLGIWGVVIASVIASAVDGLSMLYLAKTVSRVIGVVSVRSAHVRVLRADMNEIIRFAVPTNISGWFRLIQRRVDILIIGYVLGPREVGFYRIARSITNMLGFAVFPLYVTSYPTFTRLWHKGQLRKLLNIALQMTGIASAVSLVGLVIILVFGALIIRNTVGAEYLPALNVIGWLGLGTAIASATVVGQPLLLAMGKAMHALVAIGAAALVQLAVLLILLPEFGIVAAGIAVLASYLVWTSVVILGVKHLYRVEEYESGYG